MKLTSILVTVTAAIMCSGCADPLWEREGGCLNPWGGDFLGLRSAWKRVQIGRIEEDWGVGKWERDRKSVV